MGFELIGLDDDGLRGVDYLGIDPFSVFYSEEAGTVSGPEGDDGEKQNIRVTLTPAMAIFHRSWCASAAFLRQLPATNPRFLAVTPRTRRQQATSWQTDFTSPNPDKTQGDRRKTALRTTSTSRSASTTRGKGVIPWFHVLFVDPTLVLGVRFRGKKGKGKVQIVHGLYSG